MTLLFHPKNEAKITNMINYVEIEGKDLPW